MNNRRKLLKFKSKGGKLLKEKISLNAKIVGCFLTGTTAEVTPVSQISEYNFKVFELITDLNGHTKQLLEKNQQLNLYYPH